MSELLDNWTIEDAHPVWKFEVEISRDDHSGRPEKHGDVYDAELIADAIMKDPNGTEKEAKEAARWARMAVAMWEADHWTFANVDVKAVHRDSGRIFGKASTGGCDYGKLPGGEGDTGPTHTDNRDYVRSAWVDDLISEAVDVADAALKEAEVARAQEIESNAALIAEHTGADMANARAAALALKGRTA